MSSRQPNNFSGNSQYDGRKQSKRDSIVIAAPRNAQSVQYQEPVTFRDPVTQTGAIGSGVMENRNVASRSNRTGSTQYQRSNVGQSQIDPSSDPFGDRSAAKLVPPKLNSAQMNSVPRSAKRPSRAPTPRPNYAPRRNQIAATGYPQESILRQPAISNPPSQASPQAFRSSNAGFNPNGFQPPANYKRLQQQIPDPAQGGGFNPNANQPMGQPMGQPRVEPNNLRQPMQQDPMQQDPMQETDPMQVDPMNQSPMQDDPMDQDPMERQRNTFDLDCEEINGVMLQRKIRDISLTLKPNLDEGRTVPEFCSFEGIPSAPRCWSPQTFVWTASAICTKPLYYQDIQLERYGHTRGPIIQPILSVAHFFGNVAINPYKAGIHPPNECMYVLGYYRPGDCAPWLIEPFPWSIRGAAGQAASAVGYSGIFR